MTGSRLGEEEAAAVAAGLVAQSVCDGFAAGADYDATINLGVEDARQRGATQDELIAAVLEACEAAYTAAREGATVAAQQAAAAAAEERQQTGTSTAPSATGAGDVDIVYSIHTCEFTTADSIKAAGFLFSHSDQAMVIELQVHAERADGTRIDETTTTVSVGANGSASWDATLSGSAQGQGVMCWVQAVQWRPA